MDLIKRPRRLRGSEVLRKMVRETRIDKSSLIYPLVCKRGNRELRKRFPLWKDSTATVWTVFRMNWKVLQKAGVSSIMLFRYSGSQR